MANQKHNAVAIIYIKIFGDKMKYMTNKTKNGENNEETIFGLIYDS